MLYTIARLASSFEIFEIDQNMNKLANILNTLFHDKR